MEFVWKSGRVLLGGKNVDLIGSSLTEVEFIRIKLV
jgi:hypothetical protein